MKHETLEILLPNNKTKPYLLVSTVDNETIVINETHFESDFISWTKRYKNIEIRKATDSEIKKLLEIKND